MTNDISRRGLLRAGAATAALLAMPATLRAQTWPSQPVTLVLGFPPGGGSDNYVRLLGTFLSDVLGQQVLVENRPGANATIAARHVLNAKPDGYTVLFNTSSSMAAGPWAMPDLEFSTLDDFKHVTLGVESHYVLIANKDLPANTWPEFVELAKAQPGKLVHACVGAGSVNEFIVDLLCMRAGIEVNNVIYPGGGPAMTDILANQAQFMTSSIGQSESFLSSDQVKGLLIAAPERASQLPDIPASAEYDLEGVGQMAFWMGASVPKDTPDEIIQALHEAVAKAQENPDLASRLNLLGMTPVASTPAEYDARLRSDHALYGQVFNAKKG